MCGKACPPGREVQLCSCLVPVGLSIPMAARQKAESWAGDEWEAEEAESALRQKVDYRITELLPLRSSDPTVSQYCQMSQQITTLLWKVYQEHFISFVAEGVWKEETNHCIITTGRWLDSSEIIWITKSAFHHLWLQMWLMGYEAVCLKEKQ